MLPFGTQNITLDTNCPGLVLLRGVQEKSKFEYLIKSHYSYKCDTDVNLIYFYGVVRGVAIKFDV